MSPASIFDLMIVFDQKLIFKSSPKNCSSYINPFDPNEEQSFGLNSSSNLRLVDVSEQKMLVFDWSCLSQAITRRNKFYFLVSKLMLIGLGSEFEQPINVDTKRDCMDYLVELL